MPVADTVRGFKEILDGKHDDVPEGNFYMKGGIEEVTSRKSERWPSTLKLEIVTPEATVYSDDVEMVTLPGVDGQIGIYPQHMPLMTQMVPAKSSSARDGRDEFLAVGEGLVEVTGRARRDPHRHGDRARTTSTKRRPKRRGSAPRRGCTTRSPTRKSRR